jgi:signal recognition particle GTPase
MAMEVMISLQYYVKKVQAESGYFVRENNGNDDNCKVEISIAETDEPKHLIITGINGTGKTVLLTDINETLRQHFRKRFGNFSRRLSIAYT